MHLKEFPNFSNNACYIYRVTTTNTPCLSSKQSMGCPTVRKRTFVVHTSHLSSQDTAGSFAPTLAARQRLSPSNAARQCLRAHGRRPASRSTILRDAPPCRADLAMPPVSTPSRKKKKKKKAHLVRLLSILEVEFVQRFYMIAGEGDRHEHHMLLAKAREALERA